MQVQVQKGIVSKKDVVFDVSYGYTPVLGGGSQPLPILVNQKLKKHMARIDSDSYITKSCLSHIIIISSHSPPPSPLV